MPDILQTIFQRRSVRRFTDKAVAPELICHLLEAAMAAPTACNSQPWEFIVINEPEMVERVRAVMRFASYPVPCYILVCGNPQIANSSAAKHYWIQDCSAAMENLLLAAVGLGLGAVWAGIYPMPGIEKPIRALLNIPDHVIPLGMALVGYPAEGARPAPRTQYQEHRVHWQIYEPKKIRAKLKNAKHADG